MTQSRTVPDDVSLEFQLRLESDLNFVLMVFYLVNSWSWKSISLISLLDLISLCSSAKLRPATGSHRRSVGRSDSSRKHWPSSGRMHHDASYQSYLYIYIYIYTHRKKDCTTTMPPKWVDGTENVENRMRASKEKLAFDGLGKAHIKANSRGRWRN